MLEMSTALRGAWIPSSPCLLQSDEEFLCPGNGSLDEILSFGTEDSGNISLNSFWQVK
jgi:hypothetical protein